MKISYTKAQTIATCGRQYFYRYERRLVSLETSLALPFGTAVHVPTTDYVSAHALGKPFDIMKRFGEAWHEAMTGKQIKYPAHWDEKAAYDVAKRLVEQFPEAWDKSHLVAVLDPAGTPIVERWLTVPGPHGIEIELRIDVLAMDLRSGAIGILDLKTAASPHTETFGHNSYQLTTYQYAIDHHFGDFVGPIANVGFMEFVKRKIPSSSKGRGPTIEPPSWYPRRTPEDTNDMLEAYADAAKDIREKRFRRPFQGSFNSPCNLCDFARLCIYGDSTGYQARTRTAA